MSMFYVPYFGDNPAPLLVNGHRLLIVSPSEEALEDNLALLGADRIKPLSIKKGGVEKSRAVSQLAKKAKAEIVLTPPEGAELEDVIKELSQQLPWVH